MNISPSKRNKKRALDKKKYHFYGSKYFFMLGFKEKLKKNISLVSGIWPEIVGRVS